MQPLSIAVARTSTLNKLEMRSLLIDLEGQDRVAVRRQHCDHKDVGSNPAATRNANCMLGRPPAQKVPQ